MPSFDVVSEIDMQEADNAVNQAKKEVETRYDFRGSKSEIQFDRDKKEIVLLADDSMKLKALVEILNQKMSKRNISLRSLKYNDSEPAGGDMLRQKVELKHGITTDEAREIVKVIKEQKLKKVQASIQGDQVRITGPKRDDLQEAIQLLKEKVTNLDLQFTNFRD